MVCLGCTQTVSYALMYTVERHIKVASFPYPFGDIRNHCVRFIRDRRQNMKDNTSDYFLTLSMSQPPGNELDGWTRHRHVPPEFLIFVMHPPPSHIAKKKKKEGEGGGGGGGGEGGFLSFNRLSLVGSIRLGVGGELDYFLLPQRCF